jgi:mRNA-degrading endonuclease RelE of RelBE toxin-antitoxin system
VASNLLWDQATMSSRAPVEPPITTPFVIEATPSARQQLSLLSAESRQQLDLMLRDVAGFVEVTPQGARQWRDPSTLRMTLGPVMVQYAIDEERRTVTILHVRGGGTRTPSASAR